MKRLHSTSIYIMLLFVLLVTLATKVDSQKCKPSGKIRGKNPPKDQCADNCCEAGKIYNTYKCSPSVTKHTKAMLTINSFQKGGDGGGPSDCDGKFHSDNKPVVALSTGWYNKKKRCHNFITIHGNGKSVKAMVVDECDSTRGCDSDHGYQPPCDNNIVDESKPVWKALGKSEKDDDWGWMKITWKDA